MSDEGLYRRFLEAAEPSQEFALVSMGRQHVETGNLCAHRNERTMDFKFAGAIAQCRAPRPSGLKSGQEDGIAMIRSIGLEVMQYSPTRCHPACRDNDLGHWVAVEPLGGFDVADIFGNAAGLPALLFCKPVFSNVVAEDRACVDRHRAV